MILVLQFAFLSQLYHNNYIVLTSTNRYPQTSQERNVDGSVG